MVPFTYCCNVSLFRNPQLGPLTLPWRSHEKGSLWAGTWRRSTSLFGGSRKPRAVNQERNTVCVPGTSEMWETEGRMRDWTALGAVCVLWVKGRISVPILHMLLDICKVVCKWSFPWPQGEWGEIVVVDPGQPSLSPEKLQTPVDNILVHKGECSMLIYKLSQNHIPLGCNGQTPNLKWVMQKRI